MMQTLTHLIYSSPRSAAYMCQWIWSTLVQVMACRLFGAKPLSEPMLAYCQLDIWEQISLKSSLKFIYFHSRKCDSKCCLPNWQLFCPGGDEWIHWALEKVAAIWRNIIFIEKHGFFLGYSSLYVNIESDNGLVPNYYLIDGLMQRVNSIADALELHLFCILMG